MLKSSPLPSGPASRFSFPPSSFDGSRKPGFRGGQSCYSQPRRYLFYFWVSWRTGRIASSSKPSRRSFHSHRQCLHPGLTEPALPGGLRPAKNHRSKLRSIYHTRQIGSATATADGHRALTLTAVYRILRIRAVSRRVTLPNREHLCRFRRPRKSGTTESGSTGTTPNFTSFLTSLATAPPSSKVSAAMKPSRVRLSSAF